MTPSDLRCPRCGEDLRLNERGSRKSGKLLYDCRACARRFSVGPRQRLIPEEPVEDSGARTLRLPAVREESFEPLTEQVLPSGSGGMPEEIHLVLDFLDGPERGRSVRIEKTLTVIGREEGDVRVADQLVSRRHAVVEVFDPETILLKDLTSTNGTYHNGRLIDHCKLQDGDEVRIGSTILTVAIERVA